MFRTIGNSSRLFAGSGALALGLVGLLAATQLTAQSTPSYDRIEEDWEIVINSPDERTVAPQLVNVISSTWHTETQHAVFEVNHATQPTFAQGGWQLQRWYGDIYRSARTSNPATVLSTPGETVTYTLSMEVTDGVLKFSLINGHSLTWSNFGGPSESLSVASLVSNLNGYRKSLSVSNAHVGFAAHKVNRFRLKEVRYYSGGVLVQQDTTAVDIPIPSSSGT
jgi:hypothetical protein